MNSFRRQVLKVENQRKYKITNSVGTRDAYKWIRRNKWFDIGQSISEHDFYTIIRSINNYLAECLSRGEDVVLPKRLGRLEIRKFDAKIEIQDGKVKTNLPIDWDKTLKLWSDDEKAYKERTLIKMEEKEIYKIFYNKQLANYNNKSFYSFKINRVLKKKLSDNIKDGAIDAFTI